MYEGKLDPDGQQRPVDSGDSGDPRPVKVVKTLGDKLRDTKIYKEFALKAENDGFLNVVPTSYPNWDPVKGDWVEGTVFPD